MPRWNRTCLRTFLGSKFCWGKEGNKWPSPRHNPLTVLRGQRARKGNGEGEGIPSPGFPVHTPIPNLQGLHLSSLCLPFFLRLRPPLLSPATSHPFPSNPLPSPPSRPNLSPTLSSTSLSAPSSRLLPSRSCPHLSGVGSLGGWPPPQPGCRSGGGGWLCLCLRRGVGAKGATGFGGVLAPADGGEVRVGGWAHGGRSGGGLSPRLPPSLPAVSLRAGAAAAAISPTPPQRLLVSGAGQEVGGGDGRPVLPIASQAPRHLLPSTSLLGLAPLQGISAGLCLCLYTSLAPAASCIFLFPPL